MSPNPYADLSTLVLHSWWRLFVLFEVEVIGPEWYSMDRGNQSCERKRSSHLDANAPCYHQSVSVAEAAYKIIRTPELSLDKLPRYLRNITLTLFFSSSVLSAVARLRLRLCRRSLLSLAAPRLLTKSLDPFLFFFRYNDSTQKKRLADRNDGVLTIGCA
jgi:hypothetical protein